MSATWLRADDGTELLLEVDRWSGSLPAEEKLLLDRARPPVIDVGCGPGRHVLALAERGVAALGVDSSPAAVQVARARGASVLERSVFDRLPGARRWGTALLLDGNIGIGGDPVRLLTRVAGLLRADGCVLVELSPPGTGRRQLRVRIHRDGETSRPFPWAIVDTRAVADVAEDAGLGVVERWRGGRRWFARLAPA